jgi:hypothetical protein
MHQLIGNSTARAACLDDNYYNKASYYSQRQAAIIRLSDLGSDLAMCIINTTHHLLISAIRFLAKTASN